MTRMAGKRWRDDEELKTMKNESSRLSRERARVDAILRKFSRSNTEVDEPDQDSLNQHGNILSQSEHQRIGAVVSTREVGGSSTRACSSSSNLPIICNCDDCCLNPSLQMTNTGMDDETETYARSPELDYVPETPSQTIDRLRQE